MKVQCDQSSLENLRNERDHWKACAEKEEEEPFQMTKEEAWRLFERLPGLKRKTREEFKDDFTCKIRNVMVNSKREQEKAVQEWSSDMQRAIQQEERRCEPRKRTRMEQEGSNSQNRRRWEEIWGPRSPVPSPFRAQRK